MVNIKYEVTITPKHSYEIFDIHHHYGMINLPAGQPESYLLPDMDADYKQRCQMMDKFGIKRALIMPSMQYMRPRGQEDTIAMNNTIARYRDKFRSRFPVAMGTVEPLHGEKVGVAEIERCVNELHLDGFAWHGRHQGTRASDQRFLSLLKKVEEMKVVAIMHLIGESFWEAPWCLEVVLEKCPNLKIACHDIFNSTHRAQDVINIARRNPNVYLDTGAYAGGLMQAVDKVGSERVIFGSGAYSRGDLRYLPILEDILTSSLSEKDKQNILHNNALKLYPKFGQK